jgi:hypothetical protein
MIRSLRSLLNSSTRVRRSNDRRFASAVQPLEVRILPTVTASVSAGVLTLNGDATGSDLTIEADAGGVRVTSNDGSLIRFNGVNSSSVLFNGITSLKGTLGAGDDSVKLQDGLSLNNVTLQLGEGANDVEVNNVTLTGTLAVTGGQLADTLTFDSVALKTVTLNTLGGDDAVEFRAVNVSGAVTVNSGLGLDSVETNLGTGGVSSTFAGKVTINTGVDADDVHLSHATFGGLSVVSGAGNDSISLDTVNVNAALKLDAGAGDDDVTLNTVQQTGTAANSVLGGAGIDTVDLEFVLFNSATTLNLGAGTGNQLDLDDVGFGSTATISSQGVDDQVRVEQQAGLTGTTDFQGNASFNLGQNAQLGISLVGSDFYTRFFGKATFKGAKSTLPVLATIVATRSEFASPPVLKSTEVTYV